MVFTIINYKEKKEEERHMNILLVLHDCINKTKVTKKASYDADTAIEDLMSRYFPGYDNIYVYDKKAKCLQSSVDYYFHNQVIFWNKSARRILVEDYIERFPECRDEMELIIPPVGIGSGNPFDFVKEILMFVNDFINNHPIEIIIIEKMFEIAYSQLKKWAEKKKEDNITKQSLMNALYSKKSWDISELQKALEIEDVNSAMLLMISMGFKYDEENKQFVKKE